MDENSQLCEASVALVPCAAAVMSRAPTSANWCEGDTARQLGLELTQSVSQTSVMLLQKSVQRLRTQHRGIMSATVGHHPSSGPRRSSPPHHPYTPGLQAFVAPNHMCSFFIASCFLGGVEGPIAAPMALAKDQTADCVDAIRPHGQKRCNVHKVLFTYTCQSRTNSSCFRQVNRASLVRRHRMSSIPAWAFQVSRFHTVERRAIMAQFCFACMIWYYRCVLERAVEPATAFADQHAGNTPLDCQLQARRCCPHVANFEITPARNWSARPSVGFHLRTSPAIAASIQ